MAFTSFRASAPPREIELHATRLDRSWWAGIVATGEGGAALPALLLGGGAGRGRAPRSSQSPWPGCSPRGRRGSSDRRPRAPFGTRKRREGGSAPRRPDPGGGGGSRPL